MKDFLISYICHKLRVDDPSKIEIEAKKKLSPGTAEALRRHFAAPVEPVEAVGWDGDALEAQCFGFLAVRALRGLPLSLPETTGVPAPLAGGRIVRPGPAAE